MKKCFVSIILLISGLSLIISPFSQKALASQKEIVMIDLSYDSVQIHNRVAGFILEHGYGKKIDYVFADSMPGLLGLERGNYDVVLDLWVDNVPEWWKRNKEAGKVLSLGNTYPDAPQGWYVPTYVIKGDPERGIDPILPNLKSVMDLPKYWEFFKDPEEPNKGRFYNAPSGWVCHSINKDKFEAYGLDEYFIAFDPGSGTALATVIMRAYQRGEPILVYHWEPTAIMGTLDMTMLEEPLFDQEKWEENHGCAYPKSKVLKLINADFAKKNPDIVTFLKKYQSTLDKSNRALAYMQKNKATAEETALWYLKEYKEDWMNWLDDETIRKVEQAL